MRIIYPVTLKKIDKDHSIALFNIGTKNFEIAGETKDSVLIRISRIDSEELVALKADLFENNHFFKDINKDQVSVIIYSEKILDIQE